MTTYSTDAVPSSFTPDGQSVLFNAYRMGSAQSSLFPVKIFPQLYKVSIQGGRAAEMILATPALHAQYDRAANRILYEDLKGYEDPWRKHETFSVAHDIWVYDCAGLAPTLSYRVLKAKTATRYGLRMKPQSIT